MTNLIGMLRSLAAVAGLASMLAAGHAQAAPRLWLLQAVAFSDGAIATGYFAFDDATNDVTGWNISVSPGADPVFFPFTYMPGNSTAIVAAVYSDVPTVFLYAPDAGTATLPRNFRFTPADLLDGTPGTVALDLANAAANVECFNCAPFRTVVAGSLRKIDAITAGTVDVVEYYHAGLDHYFITADAVEITKLDAGTIPGWTRTGHSFRAYREGGGGGGPTVTPVCRFIGLPEAGINSHFYSGIARECRDVNANYVGAWSIESGNVFQIAQPTPTGGCAIGTAPVYRLFNNKPDANHRYTTNPIVRNEMLAAGWIPEGFGANAVVACAVQLI